MENVEQTTEMAQELMQTGYTLALTYGPKLVLAILTLIIGMWIIGKVVKGANKHFTSKADPTLGSFMSSIFSVLLKTILLIAVASMVGIETTSFIAVLGAAGLAVGLALQGSLSNFAGGVLILMFKPFKVGDLIEAQGFIATVKEIQIFNTILATADNRIIILPNGSLSNGAIVNINQEDTRRVDYTFGIGYNDDIDKARGIIDSLIKADERALKDPEHVIVISELADSSVNFTVRVWAKTGDYWGLFFDLQEKVKKAFDEQGVSIPYPQQDVHMHQVA